MVFGQSPCNLETTSKLLLKLTLEVLVRTHFFIFKTMFLIQCFLWPHLPLLPLPIYLMTDRELPFIFLAKNSFIFILKISTCPLKSSLMLLEGRLPWLDQVEVDFLPSISFVFLSVRRSPSVSLRIYFWRIDT